MSTAEESMAESIFWIAAGLIVYVYAGYPALAYVLARLRMAPVRMGDYAPDVTVVIAAYNEQRHIGATIENKLSQDYPRDKLEIIVVSDGSSDGTDKVVMGYAGESQSVKLLRQTPRAGKTSALNMAVAQARGEIIVFSDANSIYRPDSIRQLVRNFLDPAVGYVTGKMIYGNPDGSSIGDGCTTFMRYENFIRRQESRLGSVVGVDGGIDAVRKSLYVRMRPDQLPDFVLPLSVVARGYRAVYEPSAILTEDALRSGTDEYAMRVRVALRALWAMFDVRELFNPLKHGIYAWQLLSHKALRYTAFLPLVALFVSNAVLLGSAHGVFFEAFFWGQSALWFLALTGRVFEGRRTQNRVSTFAYYFALLNIASAHAVAKFIMRQKKVIWEPRTG